MLAAVNDADDITFSGVGNTFDPGDPALSINAVPEPSSLAVLAVAGLAAVRTRRRN